MLTHHRVIGHRGAAGYAPENTLTAFNHARQLGCRLIEFDVKLSAEGEAFVFHDDTLERTSNGRGEFRKATSDYIKSLDAGSWFSQAFEGQKIPLLRDVIQWLSENNMDANIEIKPCDGRAQQTTEQLLNELHYWPTDKTPPLISSFNFDALAHCHRLAPHWPLGLLFHHWHKNWLDMAQSLHCFSVHLSKRITTKKRVEDIKRHGYRVCVYTVNTKSEAQKFFNYGVDAVFSDYPDLLLHT